MKDKIIFLIIGLLIGSILTTSGFLIYNKIVVKNSNRPEMTQNGEMMQPSLNGNMGEPPEKPDGDTGEPPQKPNESNGEITTLNNNTNS